MHELELSYGELSYGQFSSFWQQWDVVMPLEELDVVVGGHALLSFGVDERVFDSTRRVRIENIPEDDNYNAFIFGRNIESSLSKYTSSTFYNQVVHIGAIYQFFQRYRDDINVTFKFDTGLGVVEYHKPIFKCTTCGRHHFYDALVFIDSNHCTCPDCEVNANKCSICGSSYHGDYCLNCFITMPCYICGVVDSVGYNKRKGEWGACDKHKHLEPVPEKPYHWKPSAWKYRHMGKQ